MVEKNDRSFGAAEGDNFFDETCGHVTDGVLTVFVVGSSTKHLRAG